MSDPTKKPAAGKKPGAPKPAAKAGEPGDWPGNAGQQPGDTWGDDNPGNVHAIGVGDHVFFHKDGAGPDAGRVVAHGVHGCTVDGGGEARHKVKWGRVLGLKQKAVLPAKVVDRGVGGAILEHPGGRRVFVAGDLPIPDEPAKLTDLSALERRAGMPRATRLDDLEPFARQQGDMAKAFSGDHDCEGPALCVVCRARASELPMVKALAPGIEALDRRVQELRAALRARGTVSVRVPYLLRKP